VSNARGPEGMELERTTGFEPATPTLARERKPSTIVRFCSFWLVRERARRQRPEADGSEHSRIDSLWGQVWGQNPVPEAFRIADAILSCVKFQPALPCQQCGVREPINVPLNANSWEWTCPKCGHENSVLSAAGWTLGARILEKAVFEYLQNGDFSTSIIFSAMAVEAELARLFFKWREIDMLREARVPSDEELDEAYRRLGFSITERIEAVGRLLDDRGVDGFARASELGERIENDFPSLDLGSLAEGIQKTVFWPRNRILHAGFPEYELKDAKQAHNIARLTLELLKEMDLARRA
jgi:hypothetical protein